MVSMNVWSGRVGFRKLLCSMPALHVAMFCVLMTGTMDGTDETSQTRWALIPDLNQLPKFDDDDEVCDASEDDEGNAVNGNADTDGDDNPDDSDNDDTDNDLFNDDNDGGNDDDDLKPSSSDDGSDDNDDDDDDDGSDEDNYEDDDDVPIRPLKKKK